MCEAAASFKLAQDNETKKALNITEFTTKGDDKIYVRCSLHKVFRSTKGQHSYCLLIVPCSGYTMHSDSRLDSGTCTPQAQTPQA